MIDTHFLASEDLIFYQVELNQNAQEPIDEQGHQLFKFEQNDMRPIPTNISHELEFDEQPFQEFSIVDSNLSTFHQNNSFQIEKERQMEYKIHPSAYIHASKKSSKNSGDYAGLQYAENKKAENKKKLGSQDQNQRETIEKKARKNTLQFYACLIKHFFERNKASKYFLSEAEVKLLDNLQKNPTIVNFDNLYKQEGELRTGLAEFFNPNRLWKQILGSKIRDPTAKIIYKTMGNHLTNGFLRKELKALSN